MCCPMTGLHSAFSTNAFEGASWGTCQITAQIDCTMQGLNLEQTAFQGTLPSLGAKGTASAVAACPWMSRQPRKALMRPRLVLDKVVIACDKRIAAKALVCGATDLWLILMFCLQLALPHAVDSAKSRRELADHFVQHSL